MLGVAGCWHRRRNSATPELESLLELDDERRGTLRVARRCSCCNAKRQHDVLDASGACSLSSAPPLAAIAGNGSPATIGRRERGLMREA
jgi:hypothetical protein